jgi:hypothetical protein
MVMAHEYRVTWCKTDKLDETLKEWTQHERGWELHNATCGGTTHGPGGRFVELTHFLYFRREF